MTILVALEHRTSYRFDRPVRVSPHVVRLRPAPHSRTPISSYSLKVEPEKHFINWQQDPFGNYLARLVFPEPTRELSFTVDLVADMTVINPFDFFLEESAEHYPFTYEPGLAADLAPYLTPEPMGPRLKDWLGSLPPLPQVGAPTVGFLVGLNQRLQQDVAYSIRMEPGVQDPEETLTRAVGSCRDTGWLLVQILRRLGLAARFVSGYLVQLTADEAPLDGPAGPAADFTDLHAWAEVYIPGAGWVGLDPTSGLFAGEGHIPLACTPEPTRAAPVTGATDPCQVEFGFANVVRRIHEDPRVTKPYTDEQWARIDALGRAVDRDLDTLDVRLTHGGEPTFVSDDDRESPEWSVAADGPAKRRLAAELADRLERRFATGALVHRGQGKWYPGEPLPRWQIAIHWRSDGRPLWRDRSLLADPGDTSAPGGDEAARRAEALARSVALRLGVPADCCVPAFEDPLAGLLAEAQLPAGPLPGTPAIDGTPARPDARAALVARLDAVTADPAGWAVPLFRRADRWATTRWSQRRGRLFLVPGDSPVGYRLPLASLTWSPPPADPERSPFEPRAALPEPGVVAAGPVGPAAVVVALAEAPTTALCVENRGGHVHVFLPPLTHLDDAVELLGHIEAAAAALATPVVIEGYPLPRDPRLRTIAVTPDPGVIEVNVHPASSWEELTEVVEGLYADARQTRLSTETFGLDGTHTGTGGGNHLTLGGPQAADSPFLRRPDLLASLVTYWQHHPALSYLFSGRFIGPTSQAPRVDEGRDDNLYELEIALGELARHRAEETVTPWLVDRLFRNLLVDVSGNTHRAEFCIDKLFNPESDRGRLGLVELRGFEMPPHARMSLVQSLLVRALVARCWKEPYEGGLVRWGTELHDRFLLPWWAEADLGEVLDDLVSHGYAMERAWFAPFLEFRFPRLGTVEVAGVSLELRGAIEPWLVLGEEGAGPAAARYVDSSTERLQVRATGLTAGRHLVTCNGRAVPLSATSEPATFVGGVRYKAWQPAAAMHPTIGVHTPLVFDVVDTWNGRSLGGCTYHVSHPGGRAYERRPVNANEAEARRVSRFEHRGHSPGPVDLAALRADLAADRGEHPRTLDLRRPRPLDRPA